MISTDLDAAEAKPIVHEPSIGLSLFSSVPRVALDEEDRSTTVNGIVSLLLASPADALSRSAAHLDVALSLVCAQLSESEKSATWTRLSPLAHLFPRSIEHLQAAASPSPGYVAQMHASLGSIIPEDGADQLAKSLRFAPMQLLLEAARRPFLDSAATAILVFRGNSDVLAEVTANPGAVFTRSSLTTLVELAPSDRRLKENLSARADMPEALSLRMLPFLNQAQMVQMFVAGAAIDTATAASDLAAERDVYHGSGVDPSRALDDTLGRLCRDARISEISEVLAERLAIPLACSMNMLCGRLDHVAGLILMASGGGIQSVDPILDLRQRLECRHSKDRRSAFDVFTRYDLAQARDLVLACSKALQASGLVQSDFDFV